MNAERIAAVIWLAIGVISIYGSVQVGLGTLHEPSSGFLSFLAGCFVVLLSMAIIAQSIFRKEDHAKLSSFWKDVDWHRPLIITILSICFILVLESLGFFLSSFILMFVIFKWAGKLSWAKSCVVPVLTLIFTYLVFVLSLKASLPRGILGF